MSTVKVNGEIFRTMVKAALSCTVKKSTFPMPECVLIKAQSGKIEVCANSLDQAVRFVHSCDVDGEFCVTVNNTTMKKALNIKGSMLTLSYEAGTENLLKISDGKKSMQLVCTVENDVCDYKGFTNIYDGDREHLFDVQCAELLNGIKAVSPFRANDGKRPIFEGYHFDSLTGKVATIDGYRACRKKWKTLRQRNEYEFTAGSLLENIKNVFNSKSEFDVNVYSSGKYTLMVHNSDQFLTEYAVRNIEGEYLDIDKSIPNEFTTEISVVAGEVTEIAKEYKGYMNEKNKKAIILGTYSGKTYLYVSLNDIRVAQQIESKQDKTAYIFAGYNAEYTMDCFGVFGKNESVTVHYKSELNPLYVTNGEFECLLLPVRLAKSEWDHPEVYTEGMATERENFENACA